MTLDQALEILNVLYSLDDPVIFEGTETTPGDLLDTLDDRALLTPAKHVEVNFYSQGGLKRGTFFSFVVDRMLIQEAA